MNLAFFRAFSFEDGRGSPSLFEAERRGRRLLLLSFKDLRRAAKEESDYVSRKKPDDFDGLKYSERKMTFGTICFVSNMDLDIRDVYEYYRTRWEIEIVFRMYKGILSLNTTREHDNYSTIGSEFVNYLSEIMVCRMKNRIQEKDCSRISPSRM